MTEGGKRGKDGKDQGRAEDDKARKGGSQGKATEGGKRGKDGKDQGKGEDKEGKEGVWAIILRRRKEARGGKTGRMRVRGENEERMDRATGKARKRGKRRME